MKAILEFNLPEDDYEFRTANNAGRLASETLELQSLLRGWLKHGHEFKTPDEALVAVRNQMVGAFDLIS